MLVDLLWAMYTSVRLSPLNGRTSAEPYGTVLRPLFTSTLPSTLGGLAKTGK